MKETEYVSGCIYEAFLFPKVRLYHGMLAQIKVYSLSEVRETIAASFLAQAECCLFNYLLLQQADLHTMIKGVAEI